MGWNSWITYACSVTEEEVKAQARCMARDLARFGYQYVVVDACWYKETDQYGRFIPDPDRFPSARDGAGFRPLADFVHGLGLKFGIHIMRGVPRSAAERNLPILGSVQGAGDVANRGSTCTWSDGMWGLQMNQPGAQAYLDSIMSLYASWGVDFIKADDMVRGWQPGDAQEVYHAAEVEGMAKAIRKAGRRIVLSLSPGDSAPPAFAPHMRQWAEMARISGDFWDTWPELKRQFGLCSAWAPYIGGGFWPDADMLPLGRIGLRFDAASRGPDRPTRFTPCEQHTLMTLWCVFRSPLLVGGDLTRMDQATLALLTNPEVLAVNQNSAGNRELFRRGDCLAWHAVDPGSGDLYLALFNLSDEQGEGGASFAELGWEGPCQVRDLWARKEVGVADQAFGARLPAHGSGLYRLSRAPCRASCRPS
jgi:hypothetical protein